MKFGKKVSNSIKKEFNSEPIYNKKYLRTEINSYEGKVNAKRRLSMYLYVSNID